MDEKEWLWKPWCSAAPGCPQQRDFEGYTCDHLGREHNDLFVIAEVAEDYSQAAWAKTISKNFSKFQEYIVNWLK